MMVGAAGGGHAHFLATTAAIVRAEGMGALFNGAWLGLAKQAPQASAAPKGAGRVAGPRSAVLCQ